MYFVANMYLCNIHKNMVTLFVATSVLYCFSAWFVEICCRVHNNTTSLAKPKSIPFHLHIYPLPYPFSTGSMYKNLFWYIFF